MSNTYRTIAEIDDEIHRLRSNAFERARDAERAVDECTAWFLKNQNLTAHNPNNSAVLDMKFKLNAARREVEAAHKTLNIDIPRLAKEKKAVLETPMLFPGLDASIPK